MKKKKPGTTKAVPKDKTSKAKETTSSTKKTDKDKIEIANRICELYEAGNVTIASCCEEVGITERTLWNWAVGISEISDRYKKAKERAATIGKEGIREKALDGLQRLITGFWIDDEEVEEFFNQTGQMISRKVRKKKKYFAPNVTAVIFALKNVDPVNWNENISIDFGDEEQVFKIGDQVIKFK